MNPDKTPSSPESSNLSLASCESEAYEIMHDECESFLRYDWRRKMWLCCVDGSPIWEELPESQVRTLIQQRMYDRWSEKENGNRSIRVAGNITTALKGHINIAKDSSEFDSDSRYLGTPSSIIDTTTGDPITPTRYGRLFLITKKLAVDPAPAGAEPERWMDFVNQCVGGDMEVIEWLQRFCGFCLLGDPKEEKMYLFISGPTNSGKSTFLETIERVMGDYGFNAEASMFTRRGNNAFDNRFEMSYLKGVRFILMDEPEEGSIWNMNRLNRLTSGSMLTSEIKGGATMNFPATGVLACGGNYIPRSTDTSGALESRSRVVEFPYRVDESKIDRKLFKSLREEYPEILRWMLDGLAKYQQDGLGTCPSIQTTSEKYSRDQSWLRRCARECFEAGDGHLKTKEIHEVFTQFWEGENGRRWEGSKEAEKLTERKLSTAINKELRLMRIFTYERSGRKAGWHGIKKVGDV